MKDNIEQILHFNQHDSAIEHKAPNPASRAWQPALQHLTPQSWKLWIQTFYNIQSPFGRLRARLTVRTTPLLIPNRPSGVYLTLSLVPCLYSPASFHF